MSSISVPLHWLPFPLVRGEFSITPSLTECYDDDELKCEVQCSSGKDVLVKNICLQLSADVVYPRRNGEDQMRKRIVCEEVTLESGLLSEPQRFSASFIIPSGSPPTFETRHLFTIKYHGFIIHARVEWTLSLVGEVSLMASAKEPLMAILTQTSITKRSLYKKSSKPFTVEGISMAKVGKLFVRSSTTNSKMDLSPTSSANESSIPWLRTPTDPQSGDDESCASDDREYDLPREPPSRETLIKQIVGGDVTKNDLQFMYSVPHESERDADKNGRDQLEEKCTLDVTEELKTILSTDYHTCDVPQDKEYLLMRASLDDIGALCNRKAIKVSVSLLNTSRFLKVRSVRVQLLQNVTYSLVGKRLGKTTVIANQKMKSFSLVRGQSVDLAFSVNPSGKKEPTLFFRFAGESLLNDTPAPTSHVIAKDGIMLIRISYMLEVKCSIWGGENIVKRIPVVLESWSTDFEVGQTTELATTQLCAIGSTSSPIISEESLVSNERNVPRSLAFMNTSGLASGRQTVVGQASNLRQLVDFNVSTSSGARDDTHTTNNFDIDRKNTADENVVSACNGDSNKIVTSSDRIMLRNRAVSMGNASITTARAGCSMLHDVALSINSEVREDFLPHQFHGRRSMHELQNESVVPLSPQSPGRNRIPARIPSMDSWDLSLPHYDDIHKRSTKSFGPLQQYPSPMTSPRTPQNGPGKRFDLKLTAALLSSKIKSVTRVVSTSPQCINADVSATTDTHCTSSMPVVPEDMDGAIAYLPNYSEL